MTPSQSSAPLVAIIDDDRDIREVLAQILLHERYQVLTAQNGAEALARLAEVAHAPSLILLDLMMPVMDGEQFREAQRKSPALADVPVIVLSGDSNIAARATAIGAVDYVLKPIELHRLLTLVQHHCQPAA